MKNRIADISLRKAAIVAGLGLLFMMVFAVFANFSVFPKLIVPGDAAATANNIVASEGLFRAGIFSFIIVAILDLVVALALYVLLKPVHKSLSLLAALFRLVYATIFGVALTNYFNALLLLSGADYLAGFETAQLQAQVMLFLNAFSDGWNIGYVFFGLHLFFLGYLVFKSSRVLFKSVNIPRILGVLLIIASLGYLFDSIGKILLPSYDLDIALYTFIGEFLFMLWLLIKGWKVPETES
jgi:hypothetical protein